jgi:hypothetical protein
MFGVGEHSSATHSTEAMKDYGQELPVLQHLQDGTDSVHI